MLATRLLWIFILCRYVRKLFCYLRKSGSYNYFNDLVLYIWIHYYSRRCYQRDTRRFQASEERVNESRKLYSHRRDDKIVIPNNFGLFYRKTKSCSDFYCLPGNYNIKTSVDNFILKLATSSFSAQPLEVLSNNPTWQRAPLRFLLKLCLRLIGRFSFFYRPAQALSN